MLLKSAKKRLILVKADKMPYVTQNALLKLKRKEGETQSNLNQLLVKLFPPKEKKGSKKQKHPLI